MKNVLLLALAFSSMQAFAQRYEIGKATKTLEIRKETTKQDVTFLLPLYRIDQVVVSETVSCRIPLCSSEYGDGSTGNWYHYFSTPKELKAQALASAIKGIGKVTAEKIVNYNLFTIRPLSWKAFTHEIYKIEDKLSALGYHHKFSTQVLEVYGYDNRINLGYGSEQTCRYVDTYCTQKSLKEVKSYSHSVPRNLTVYVKGHDLQSFEKDTVQITVGDKPFDIKFTGSGHHRYIGNIYYSGVVLELLATRIRTPFPSSEVEASLTKNAQNSLTLNFTVPSKYQVEDAYSTLEVTYEICHANWFGGCYSVISGPTTEVVKNNKLTKTFSSQSLVNGSKYFVRARFSKVNSHYYNEGKSTFVYSNTIRF